MQGLYYWFPMDKQTGHMTLQEQQTNFKEIVSDEVIAEMNRRKGQTAHFGAVKFITEAEAYHALKEAARALAG